MPLRSLSLIATGTLASIAILMATFDQIAYALEFPLDGLTSINAADPADIAEGTYEVPAWHQVIGYDLLRVSSADGKTSLYDGRCFVFVNTVDGTALLWQGDDLGILRVSLDGLALAECTD